MQTDATRTGPFASAAFCLLLAAVLTVVFTAARGVLSPVLGHSSPYTLYIAAVLIAGFARGGLCGVIVMLAGGVAGFLLFAGWDRTWTGLNEPLVSLVIFWMVAGLVLMMSNELRRHANITFARLHRRVEASRAQPSGESSARQNAV